MKPAASPACLALPVSFAADQNVQSEKESDPRGSKAVHDIENVIVSMQRTISVAPKPPPFRSQRLPWSNWARQSRTPAKIADKLKKRPRLDQPAFNRRRLKAEKLIDSKVLKQLIRVQVDAGCTRTPVQQFC